MMQLRTRIPLWIAAAAATALLVAFNSQLGPLAKYPESFVLPVGDLLNMTMEAFVSATQPLFRLLARLLEWPVEAVRMIMGALPWVTVVAMATFLAWRISGMGLAAFAGGSLLYMVALGYWEESVNTFSLVAISVPLAVVIGFILGAVGYRSRTAYRIIMPALDLFQTLPAFAYLLPILLLFGFGTSVGLVASVIFSFPPMVRNTILGLRGVPDAILESGLMSGATSRQQFWTVLVPTARRQLMLGVNQTTMASLSMVIISSVIGGTNDIGWEVLSTIRRADFGGSLLAGIVIALMAMVLDRFSSAVATRTVPLARKSSAASGWPLAGVLFVGSFCAAQAFPASVTWPLDLPISPQGQVSALLTWFVAEFGTILEAIKNAMYFFVMLPIKVGFGTAVSPFSWGFAMTPSAYAAVVAAISLLVWYKTGRVAACFMVIGGLILFRGITGTPWIVIVLVLPLLVWQYVSLRLAGWTLASLLFLLMTGLWQPAMLSVYLCGIGALLAFALGSSIGIWCAESEGTWRIVRPIIDTLQTMPQFVLLIPFVMIFRIGEFTAVLAIICYSIVPAIRYTQHGLRGLPSSVLEAAEAMGTTRWQRLVRVKLPLAMPSIMLGLNQTIMFAISMLVITALVGTSDLGQEIYVGLSKGDFGIGMTAGIAMTVIAMLADRITKGLSDKFSRRSAQFEVAVA